MEDKTRETPVTSPFTLTNIVMFFVLALTGFINLFTSNKIAFTLIIPFLIAVVLLTDYYKKSKILFYYKKHVNICRIIAIALTVIICGSPTMILFFNRTKPFYHLKQAVYSCGFSNVFELRAKEFPDFLPKECEDYYFIIKPHAPFPEAPDTFASVSFYTDEETIEKYEREFAGKGYEKINSDKTFEDIMIENEINLSEISEMDSRWLTKTYIKEKGVPQYIVNFTEEEKILDLSRDAIVYNFRSRLGFTSGCLLDYDSGLVIFWA